MLLIVIYHFLEINANKSDEHEELGENWSKTVLEGEHIKARSSLEDEVQKGGRQATGPAGRGGSKGGVARG